jgi:hypothetical protein
MATQKLSTTGFDIPETTFIKTSVELASGMDIGQWEVVDDKQANAVLVNTDALSLQAAISQYATSDSATEGLFIQCSEDGTKPSAATLSLKRPITYPALISLLTKLEVELRKPSTNASPKPIAQPPKRFHSAIPRPLPPPKASPSIIVSKILKDLPTQEIEMERESVFIPPEPTTEVEYLEEVDEESVNISDLFKAAEVSVLNDIVRPTDSKTDQIPTKTPTVEQLAPKAEQAPLHSVENVHPNHIGLIEGSERDLLLLDRPARRFYQATRYLGILKNAIEKNQATEITHYQFSAVRIYPDQKTYATPKNSEFPIKMFRTLAVEFSSQKLTRMSEKEPPIDWEIKPLWQLLFMATLYGSEGRLMEGTQLSDELQLVAEPDYNIVPGKSEYEAIAGIMKTYETINLKTIADKSRVRIETVIDFCNACEQAQLIKRFSQTKLKGSSANKTRHSSALYRSPHDLNQPQDSGNTSLAKRIKSIFKHS